MHLCLFEDSRAANFFPLTSLRPVYGLRCGLTTLAGRAASFFSRLPVDLHVRAYLAELVREEYPGCSVNAAPGGDTLYVNGRLLMNASAAAAMRAAKSDTIFTSAGEVAGAFVSARSARSLAEGFTGDALEFNDLIDVPRIEVGAPLVDYPWDLVAANEEAIEHDFARLAAKEKQKRGEVHRTAVLLRPRGILIGKEARIGALVVLDATQGPIVIGAGAVIQPHSYIEGPCAIGAGSLVKPGSQILGGTSLGPVCRVGGEVSHSILQECANKQHHGYLGHGYLGAWVNLGAGTTTSNLKNTYGSIRVTVNGVGIDTGRMFVGLTAGDHVKTGINAAIDTGTVIGVSSNVFGTALPPKYVPAFAWGESSSLTTYDFEKALAVASTVMRRREKILTPAYAAALRTVFSMTAHERTSFRR